MSLLRAMKVVYLLVASALIFESMSNAQEKAAPPAAPATEDKPVADEATLKMTVTGRSDTMVGEALAASQGRVGQPEIAPRPIVREGEVLETIPGMIATQHSGGGKANQYFLRGFNLDHGTDFATSIEGMPVNMRTHGHGQGYTDVNFLIPELVEELEFRKGPYYADDGDFAGAGSARIKYFDYLNGGMVKASGGSFGQARILVAGSPELKSGKLIGALEAMRSDGPWERSDQHKKLNGMIKYGNDVLGGFGYVQGMAYSADWGATDQIPRRAERDGRVDRFGSLDSTTGGYSQRYSFSTGWMGESDLGRTEVQLYTMFYKLNLWSNFTYFLNDPVNGDQFEQVDSRWHSGGTLKHTFDYDALGAKWATTLGMDIRNDKIDDVGLNNTRRRSTIGTVRHDEVVETSISPWMQHETRWLPWFRTIVGLRGDVFYADVDSDNPANSGSRTTHMVSPKGSFVFGPFHKTEFFVSGGTGFHSNDARSWVQKVDPVTLERIDSGLPLARVRGIEVGARTTYIKNLHSSLSLWYMDNDSELIFVGDAGTVEPNRGTKRYGVEFANYYRPLSWLTFDFDFTWTHAWFKGSEPEGDHVPNSIDWTVNTGISVDHASGFFASARLRFFGAGPLIEDNSIRSHASAMLNARAGYNINKNLSIFVEGFNLLDREDSDIEYFFESRLPGEPAEGVADRHYHPVNPISFRAGLTYKW